MWITHKTKEGDTLASIVKKYKTKDPKSILKHPKNRAFAKQLGNKEPLAAGLLVWVPDPNTRVYIVYNSQGKKFILSEKQFKLYEKRAHSAMDNVLRSAARRLESLKGNHASHQAMIDEHFFVSSIVEAFNPNDEPKNHRKIAEDAVKRLSKAVKGRNYGSFEKEGIYAEKMLIQYQNGISDWISGSVGSGETIVDVLEVVKAAGLFCAGMVAVTVAAPATLTSGILFGAASGITFGLTYDGADALGRAAVDTKQMSGGEWMKRMAVNGVSGGAGGAISGGVLNHATKPLFAKLMTKTATSNWARETATRHLTSKLLDRELVFAAEKILKKGGGLTINTVLEAMPVDDVLRLTLLKFINRMASGGLLKLLKSEAIMGGYITAWTKGNPKKLSGNDGKKVGEAAANDLATQDLASELFDIILKKNIGVFQKDLRAALQKPAAIAEKKLLKAK